MTKEDRPVYAPSAEHPITITDTGKRVTVRVSGEIVAETDSALTLQESTYPPVQYVPLADVVRNRLRRSDVRTYCPYKGDAGYYSVVTSHGDVIEDVVWEYEEPYGPVATIAGHVAFYSDRAEIAVGN